MSSPSPKKPSSSHIARKILFIFLHFLKWVLVLIFICGFVVAGTAFGYVTALVKDEPIRPKSEIMEKMMQNDTTGFVYFNNDETVGQLRTDEDRRLVELKDIPQRVKDAFLSIEDNEFYTHPGIDLRGTIRAVLQKVSNEDVQTGGSTITQQLARRVFLSLDRTSIRKAKEIFLALRIERFLSKDEILVAYLNKIPFGNASNGYNLFGIKAAAKGIFDINDLHKLTIAQAAYLAGLPQLPSRYSAFNGKGEFNPASFKLAETRKDLVLRRMYEQATISKQQYEEALKFNIKATLAQSKEKAYTTYPYLMLEAERQAAEILLRIKNPELEDENLNTAEHAELMKNAREHMLRSGYHIYTTIDPLIYALMHEISENPENFSPDDETKGIEQIGSIMIDNQSGAILGMIEGRNFYVEQLNHATQMVRQPGSAMKPIAAYIPALEKGVIQPGGTIDDSPVILKDGSKGFHIPENWNNKFHGFITARHAFNQSYNIPAIKLFLHEDIGITEAWNYAKQMGITTLTAEDEHAQTGVIGGLKYGVTVEELSNAFATIGNKGVFNDAYMIRMIKDANGQVVYEYEHKPKSVFSEETAYLMTDMMRTVITSGTATDLMTKYKHHKEIPVVGKTGSTQEDADAWFIGFSPNITVGVWAGYDQPIHKLSKSTEGTQRAKNIWAMVMNAAVEGKPELFTDTEFVRPDNIVSMTVSSVSGKLPSALVKERNLLVTDLFNKKYIPTEEDDVLVKMKVVFYNGFNYIPQPDTPSDMVSEKIVIKRDPPIKELIAQISELFAKYPNSVPIRSGGARRSPQDYFPMGTGEEAPSQVDPRVDDGKQPEPPSAVEFGTTDGANKITFQWSKSEDVVGYRIYRSLNDSPFSRINGNVVLTGQEPRFLNYSSPNYRYGYYVTAVDVAGNESNPSTIVYSDEHSSNPDNGMVPPIDDPDDSNVKDPGEATVPETLPPPPSDAPATAPANITVQTRDGGLGIVMNWVANPKDQAIISYHVYYSDTMDGLYREIGSSDTNTFEYISIPIQGWYRVIAENSTGSSTPSASIEYKDQ